MSPGYHRRYRGLQSIAKLVESFLAQIEEVIATCVRERQVAALRGLEQECRYIQEFRSSRFKARKQLAARPRRKRPRKTIPRRKGPKHGRRIGPQRTVPSRTAPPASASLPSSAVPETKAVVPETKAVVPETTALVPETKVVEVPAEHQVTRKVVLTDRGAAQVLEAITSEAPIPPPPPALQQLVDRAKGAAETMVVPRAQEPAPEAPEAPESESAAAPATLGDRPRVGQWWRRKHDHLRGRITAVISREMSEGGVQYMNESGRRASVSLVVFCKKWELETPELLASAAAPTKGTRRRAGHVPLMEPTATLPEVMPERPRVGQCWRRKDGSRETTVVQVEGRTYAECVVTILNRKTFGRPSMRLCDFLELWEPAPATANSFKPVDPAVVARLAEMRAPQPLPVLEAPARMLQAQDAADAAAAADMDAVLEESRAARGLVRELRVADQEDEVFVPAPREDLAQSQDEDLAREPEEEVSFAEFDTGESAVKEKTSPATPKAVVLEGEPERPRYRISDDDSPTAPVVERARSKATTAPDGRVRARTIAGRLTRDEQRAAGLIVYPGNIERPLTREDCADMPRPCPFVSCVHHLYLDVDVESGAVKLNFPHLEVWQMAETCSLDVADRGGITLEEVGAILNLTRERIRQVEVRGLYKIRQQSGEALGISKGESYEAERGMSALAEEIDWKSTSG